MSLRPNPLTWRDFGLGQVLGPYAISEFDEHSQQERPHQSLDNEVIETADSRPTADGEIHVHDRLGGQLRHYRPAA